MDIFKSNMTSLYGEKGKIWIAELPGIVHELGSLWNLTELKPVADLTYNYVMTGFRNKLPIVLKISFDAQNLERESNALKIFEGFGAVKILKKGKNAILLQRASSGKSLRGYVFEDCKKNIEIVCNTVQKLHRAPLPLGNDFPHIREHLAVLDEDWNIPIEHLLRARNLRDELLESMREGPILLHGDLHQGNILSHGDKWLVIDPKGIVGYPINELWACVEDINYDLEYMSEYFKYPLDKVIKWYYVHIVLSACWQVGDNIKPLFFLTLAEKILPLIERTVEK